MSAVIRLRFGRREADAADGASGGRSSSAAARPTPSTRASCPSRLTADERLVARQALSGMLWGKQFYHYNVTRWLDGDPAEPPPPPERLTGRNAGWRHLDTADVVSMPDKWEYPWFAAWDLGFQCVALAHVDPEFAKEQLILLCREWYMHANGQLPGVRVVVRRRQPTGARVGGAARLRDRRRDRLPVPRARLPQAAHQLHLVGEPRGRRGQQHLRGRVPRPRQHRPVQPLDAASRRRPPRAVRRHRVDGDVLAQPPRDGAGPRHLRPHVRGCGDQVLRALRDDRDRHERAGSLGRRRGLLLRQLAPRRRHACADPGALDRRAHPALRGDHARSTTRCAASPISPTRLRLFIKLKPRYAAAVSLEVEDTERESRLLAIVDPDRLRRILEYVLDEAEFLSDHGLRALSRFHADHPLDIDLGGAVARLDYEPAESTSRLYGGNSNWRGPVWFPVNHLIIEALRVYHRFLGDTWTVEYPRGSGRQAHLGAVADDIAARLASIFLHGADGVRPVVAGHRAVRAARPRRCHPVPRVLSRRDRAGARRVASDRVDRPGRRSAAAPNHGGARSLRHRVAAGASGYTRLTNGGRTPGARHPRSRGDAAHRR